MIGALYQLVENGEVCKGLEAGAAPRTAIGQKADGSLVLYTIDGRRKGYSIGASLTQVAQRMIELGCVTALSLDGGGSTTLCVTLPEDGNAGVYNTPSEGSLRAVTNHIFLVASNEPSGTLDHIALRTESDRVLAGAQVLLRAAAIDTNYIPMDKEVSIASDRGSVRTDELGNTVLTAPKTAGTVTVGAKVGGKYTTAELRVIETPDEIRLSKSGTLTELSLEGESGALQYAVIGIGVNCNNASEDFPPELREVATSLYLETGKRVQRAALAAALIEALRCAAKRRHGVLPHGLPPRLPDARTRGAAFMAGCKGEGHGAGRGRAVRSCRAPRGRNGRDHPHGGGLRARSIRLCGIKKETLWQRDSGNCFIPSPRSA